jgi:polyhydroxybutyrate depolymerase
MPARPAFVFLIAFSGCGHSAAPSALVPADAAGDAAGRVTDAAADAAVDGAASEAGGPARTLSISIESGGRTRMLVVHSPANLSAPAPLVFNLHGSGGNAIGEGPFSGMDQAADSYGFIAAYPEGAIPLGAGFAWNVPGQPLLGGGAVPADAPDDSAFIADAISALERSYSIDPKRIYAAGMSGGARMASELGCRLSQTLAAVAPIAGIRFPTPCDSTRPMPVIAFHGTADTVNPYDGAGEAYWTYSVPSAAEQWAAHDTCNATPTLSQAAPSVELRAYAACAGGAEVDLYTISGAGHEWPGAPQQTTAIDANAVMWAFFAAHPLP